MSCYIIAEVGVNHNGDLSIAKKLIDVAHFAGADAVKFQSFQADLLVTQSAPKAKYQLETTDESESQWTMLKKLELNEAEHHALFKHCQERGIEFLSTPFDFASLSLLTDKVSLKRIKISSGDLTNSPMLLAAAKSNCKLILSTGMANIKEIEYALSIVACGLLALPENKLCSSAIQDILKDDKARTLLKDKVSLLHCTTNYPADIEDINLNALDTLAQKFGLPVGYSDHSLGDTVAQLAVAKGATIIEKHITLDCAMPGPDHRASIEPDEFKSFVKKIRQVEVIMGNGIKEPQEVELNNIPIARKSLVANQQISQGELFTPENLIIKRPGTGVSPEKYWDYLGTIADKDYLPGELID